MKNLKIIVIILLAVILNAGFSNVENKEVVTDLKVESNNDKWILKGKKQQLLLNELKNELKHTNLTIQDLEQDGAIYFNDQGLGIQIKENSNIKTDKMEKLKITAENMKIKFPNELNFEYVKYSYMDLIRGQDTFKEFAKIQQINTAYQLSLDVKGNKLDLKVESITPEVLAEIKDTFGDMVIVTIDSEMQNEPRERLTMKTRTQDWNSLGGGIGIKFRKYESSTTVSHNVCTLAGVAHKNGEMWAITAGHCLEQLQSPLYQWDATLGTPHLNALPSDYDFGLIKINGSGIVRYASNGLYEESGSTTYPANGYDRSYYGTINPSERMVVCKSGISSGTTCGYIETARTVEGYFGGSDSHPGEVYTTVAQTDGSGLVKSGDSGGPWWTTTPEDRVLLVGITAMGRGTLKSDGFYTKATFCPFVEVANKYGVYLYTNSSKTQIN